MASPSNNLDYHNDHSLTQSAAASLDSLHSPAPCASTEDSNPLTQEDQRTGKLHLVPCTLDAYLDLPNKAEDRYELVEGILLHHSNMADSQHTFIKEYLAAKFKTVERTGDERVNVYTETKVQVGEKMERGVVVPVVRIPDVVVGPYVSSDKKPRMVIEITSPSNRMTDIDTKSKEYCGLGIGLYVIVDRDENSHHPHGCVRVRIRHRPHSRASFHYSETVYEGDALVDCFLFRERNLTAAMVLGPPQTAEEVTQSPTKRERLAKEAAQSSASAAQKENDDLRRLLKKEKEKVKKEQEKAKKEKERAKKEKEKAKKRKKQLKDSGVPTSDSSSSSASSPPSQRQRGSGS